MDTEIKKQKLSKDALQRMVVREAAGEWGCEDLTGVTVEKCDAALHNRNWTVTHLENEDLPAAAHTIAAIVERLAQQYELEDA
jgi:hypothetical protein